MSNKIGLEPTKQNKHSQLQDAIDDMEFIVEKAASLLDRINGNATDCSPDNPRVDPSLSSVLNSGPSEIRDNCSKIRSYLDEIEGALF